MGSHPHFIESWLRQNRGSVVWACLSGWQAKSVYCHFWLTLSTSKKQFVSKGDATPLANIDRLITTFHYDLYVQVVFRAERDSLWELQTGWSLPNGRGVRPLNEVSNALRGQRVYRIHKQTRSAFHGDPDLLAILETNGIQELHLAGFDLNDCVMASAFDTFDNGFFTYVIEECCGESRGSGLRSQAIEVLRYLNLTNNSVYESIPVITLGHSSACGNS